MTEDKCRICLDTGILLNIFDNEELLLPARIMTVARVNVQPDDGLPKTICSKCLERLNNCIEFITLCQQSSLTLKAMLVDRGNVSDAADICEFYDSDNDINFLHADSNNVKDKEFEITVQKKTNVKLRKHRKEQCFTCGKVMSSRFRLKTHLRTHTGERPFTCPHCNKNFSLAQNLKVHLRTHTGEKPLTCTICGASFAQSAGLSAHRRKHTGQTPYKCTLCPRSFRTIGHMQYHVRCHTGEKKFECDVCGKAFIARSDLKQHLVIHTEDKPHVCCICGLRLRRASHLKRHMLQLHAQQKETVSERIKESI